MLLEKMIGRKLIYFTCRHVLEIMAGETFFVTFGRTTSPEVVHSLKKYVEN